MQSAVDRRYSPIERHSRIGERRHGRILEATSRANVRLERRPYSHLLLVREARPDYPGTPRKGSSGDSSEAEPIREPRNKRGSLSPFIRSASVISLDLEHPV